MIDFYHEGSRALQDEFGTRALADNARRPSPARAPVGGGFRSAPVGITRLKPTSGGQKSASA
jgi:hypothetical protein